MKDDNKPKLFIYILLTVVFVVLIASCGGGGGGGGGGMVAFAPDNNMPNNGGDAGGWGTGTDTGGGGIGGSSVQEDNATLLLGQSAALSYQKVDIDLVVNGEHFAINNVTATTTTEVLPNIPLGATVSGTATIYLINGTTRTALLEMTEIGIHNNLVFKVPYNYTCVDASSVAEITSGTYFSRDGIDLSSFTNHPVIGWKCQEDGSVHAGGYITGVRGDITLEPLFDTGGIYNITYVSPITSQSVPDDTYTSVASKTLPVLSESNLTFAGWYDNQSYNGQPVATIPLGTTGDKVYYAKWTAAVEFNPNGGGGGTDTRNVVYGTKTTRPATHPTPPSGSSATFDDWYTGTISGGVLTLDSTAFDFDNTVINETTVLYARWVTTISFNANGGSSSFSALNNVALGSKITVPSPGPTRDNYVFTGWYKNSGCAEADRFKFSDPIDKGMTLYAGWQQVNQSGTRDTWFESDAGISITDNVDGNTTYCLRLNNNSVSGLGTALAVTNNKPGTTTTAYLDIQGTNSFSATSNHGGLKLTTSPSAPAGSKSIKIVFCTSSSGTITLYGGRGCIQVENVTATFELMSGCKATEMKIGSTTYTDFNTFVNAMKNESFSSNMTATLKIERE